MTDGIIYILSFIFFFFISLKVLLSLNVEQLFKSGRVWEIKTFTLLISIICAHLLSEVVLKIVNFNFFTK